MKTLTFYENYNTIKHFCKHAKQGFIVVETNSEITKNEFVELLMNDFEVCKKELNEFVIENCYLSEDAVVLVDEFYTSLSSEIIINLNYNRNWFLNLHRNIIFILRPSTVNELIRYSSSFWSFVTLHKVFSCRFSGIIQPHFINGKNDWGLNGLVKSYKYQSSNIFEKSNKYKIQFLLSKYLGQTQYSSNIIECLDAKLDTVNKNSNADIAYFLSNLLSFVEALRRFGCNKEAKIVLDYIDQTFSIHEDYIELEIKKLKLLADTYYDLSLYDHALEVYELLYRIIINHPNSREDSFVSTILNNSGIIYYKKQQYSEALDCYNSGVQILNYSDEYFILINLLFNLSLLHYQIDDYYNALYYIDIAIDKFDKTNARREKILLSKCKVLKAYLLINMGDLNVAQELLQDSLSILRTELDEKCISILEIHYVFATLYLYKNDLNHAETCALKAYKVMKSISPPMYIRCHVRELLGEIYFYKCDYQNALTFLKTSYRHSENKDVFSNEILNWIEYAIKYCKKHLS